MDWRDELSVAHAHVAQFTGFIVTMIIEVAEGEMPTRVLNNNTWDCILGLLDCLSISPSISSSADSLLNMCKQSFTFRPQPWCVNSVPLAYPPYPRPYSSHPSISHLISSHHSHSLTITPIHSSAPSGLFSLHWKRVALDEAHTIKNADTEAAKACYMVDR